VKFIWLSNRRGFKGIKGNIAFLKSGDDELELVEYIIPKADKTVGYCITTYSI
jgi:hypothetical protein